MWYIVIDLQNVRKFTGGNILTAGDSYTRKFNNKIKDRKRQDGAMWKRVGALPGEWTF